MSERAHDAAGRVTGAASPAGALSLGYDAAGRRTQLTINGNRTSYTYDTAGRVSSQADGAGSTAFGYTADGLLSSISRPNGVDTAFTFDAAARLTAVRHNGAGTSEHFDYTLDAAGNRIALTGPAGTETFTYDALNRLTAATGGGGATSYAYDAAGNRKSVTTDGASTAYVYNAAGQLSTVGGDTVSVDADGNITAFGGETFTYNAANQLTGITTGGASTEFGYDADGNRTRTSGATTGRALFDPAAEVPTAVVSNGAVIARDPNANPLTISTTAGIAFPLVDALGSVRASTNSSGAVTAETDYDPYGQVRATTGTLSPVGYTGALTDPAGLVNLNARDYHPGLGQFLQTDTYQVSGPGTTGYNRHTYANDNPLRYTDPTGHTSLGEQSGAMGVQSTLHGIGQQSASQLLRHFARHFAKMMGQVVRNRLKTCVKQALLEAPADFAINAAVGGAMGGAAAGAEGAVAGATAGISAGAIVMDVSGSTISCVATGSSGGPDLPDQKFYRGARPGEEPSFTPRPHEFKVDAEGNVRDTHGVSVFDSPERVSEKGFQPFEVDQNSIPDELRIIQRGSDSRHFEIVPRPGANLTTERYTELLCFIRICR